MADEYGEKTEAPTPRRRQEAREQGQVARSQDLTGAVLVIGVILLLNAFGQDLVKALRALLAETLSLRTPDASAAAPHSIQSLARVATALAPVLAGVVLLIVLANLLQVGFTLNLKRLQPNLGALNPLKGIGRLFGKGRSPVQALLAIAKLTALVLVAYWAIRDRLAMIVAAQELSYLQVFALGVDVVFSIAMRIGIALLVLAILDYVWQRWRMEQQLRMTKQEVKEEMRRMEGDPKIKQRRRQIAMQIAHQRLKKDVPTADVVVTNPTEFAVALKYDATAMHAPRVIAKGQGLMAQRIREIAIASGVPILERKPLARALFKLVEVGREIPEQFYSAVAEILAYVYELSGKARPRQTA
jgi:flagellar biosynthetic protein FlhB